MSFPVESFWRLVVEAQLMTLEDCHRHHAAWLQQHPQGGDAQALAEFLVATNVISKYQASILLAGRAGPFVYGDYRIYERIETGRLAGIFRALHIPTMHRVCLQFLTPEQAASPETVGYLAQMAAFVSRSSASFPHLLRCYHLVDLGAFKFFVLEDLLGKRVERVLQQTGALKPGEACRIARQAAFGLGRLHAMQQAHGDVRPQNLWIDQSAGQNNTIKLLQFPLSRDPLAPPIDWRQLVAAPPEKIPVEADYVAPELIAGAKPDARSDLYQLGCSLYQMLTNKVPFPADTLRGKLEGHMKGQPTPIEKLNPRVPPELTKLVAYLMQKKPDMRFQQAGSFIEKLLPFMSPAEAQSQPQPASRAAQAYDAWLLQLLQSGAAAPQPAAQQAFIQQPAAAVQSYAQQPFGAQPAVAAHQYVGMPSPGAVGPAVAAGPVVGGSSSSLSERIAARKQKQLISRVIMLAVLAIAGFVGYVFKDQIMEMINKPSQPVTANPMPTATATATAAPVATATATASPVAGAINFPKRDAIFGVGNDPMFASPTAGKTLNLAHLTPGVQLIVALRPAEIMKHPEAAQLFDAKVSGELGTWMTTTLPQMAGVAGDKIEQLLIGVLDGPSAEAVRYAYVVRLVAPMGEADLAAAWGSPPKEKSGDAEFYAKGPTAYYVPKSEAGKVFAILPKEEMPNLLKFQGAPPTLRPGLDFMALETTDADRHFTALYAPYFLETGGKSLLAGSGGKLMTAFNWLITGVGLPPLATAGDAAPSAATPSTEEAPKAVVVSAHLTDSFFYEVRIWNGAATAYNDAPVLPLATRVKEIPQRVDDYTVSITTSPYGRRMLRELPRMVKFAGNYARVGAADRQLVLRGYVPAVAAHNLVLGANLCLIESAGGGVAAPGATQTAAAGGAAGPKGVLDLIRTKKMALSFDRNDLNKVLEIVSTEAGVPIEMVGTDFQLAGITKNQSMGLMEPEQTIDKLLQTILMKADMAGRLVYVIKPRNPGEEEMIFIATRAGVAQRGEKLLPEFEQAPGAKK